MFLKLLQLVGLPVAEGTHLLHFELEAGHLIVQGHHFSHIGSLYLTVSDAGLQVLDVVFHPFQINMTEKVFSGLLSTFSGMLRCLVSLAACGGTRHSTQRS